MHTWCLFCFPGQGFIMVIGHIPLQIKTEFYVVHESNFVESKFEADNYP